MSLKQRIASKLFGGVEPSRLAECIDAGIAQVAKMGKLPPEEVRAKFEANLMMMGFSPEEISRLRVTPVEAVEPVKQEEA
jgi:hypothetical protein